MNVLFFFRENPEFPNYLIRIQAENLSDHSINIEYFPLKRGGIIGYLYYGLKLREKILELKIDLVHAHYSFSGIIAGVFSPKPVICSLMGTDLNGTNRITKLLAILFSSFIWKITIVKSKSMINNIRLKNCYIVPNGVDFNTFQPVDGRIAREILGIKEERIILFICVSPESKVKNLKLAREAIEALKDSSIKLLIVSNIENNKLKYYYSAADLLLLTSTSEGSPNVIKEAMACNCPIIATNVGDVQEVISGTEGCYIVSFDPHEIAAKIRLILSNDSRTNGRERIKYLGLESTLISEKIISLYANILAENDRNS